MSLSPPGVRLFYDPRGHHAGAINELCWGLEEQGVPCQTIPMTEAVTPLRWAPWRPEARPCGWVSGSARPAR